MVVVWLENGSCVWMQNGVLDVCECVMDCAACTQFMQNMCNKQVCMHVYLCMYSAQSKKT